jgi:hypothetical protein
MHFSENEYAIFNKRHKLYEVWAKVNIYEAQ